jgi:succinate-acetate transporter protein
MTPTDAERVAQEQLAARTLVTLRPLAGPLALGFLALAGASLVVSGLQLGWVEPTEGKKVTLIVLAFTVPLQLLASILGFLARDAVAATGMGLLAGIWAAFALVTFTSRPGSTSDALGLFLLLAFAAMLAPATAAVSSKLVPALVLASAAIRFGLGGLHQLTGSERWEDVAGVWGLWLAALAVYAAYAAELEDALRRTVLPLGRRGKGEQAVQGTYAQQIAEVHKEPGVRQQL